MFEWPQLKWRSFSSHWGAADVGNYRVWRAIKDGACVWRANGTQLDVPVNHISITLPANADVTVYEGDVAGAMAFLHMHLTPGGNHEP